MATVTTMQAVPQNTVIIQQGPRKPENYMVMAVLVTFFCNCPLGTLAWIFSCLSDSSYNEGSLLFQSAHGSAFRSQGDGPGTKMAIFISYFCHHIVLL